MKLTVMDIRALRTEKLGLNQAQFATLFGVHPVTVSKWEHGKLNPTEYQQALMEAFETAANKQQDEVRSNLGALLLGAGIAAALFFLLKLARE